jgi:GT2 family glycosyltransferase
MKTPKFDGITIAIPTYDREQVLIETIRHLLSMYCEKVEVLVLDQSKWHTAQVESELARLHKFGRIRWCMLNEPSIPKAMNRALTEASHDLVLFVDDDIIPENDLIRAHVCAHEGGKGRIVAGRVIQPWQEGGAFSQDTNFHFASLVPATIHHFMGGNFSLDRREALAVGGFDENFVRVAYQFEAEFAHRWRNAGLHIVFEPKACIHHLKVPSGGTRIFGHHLTTAKPDHSVGAYYFYLRTWSGLSTLKLVLKRLIGAVATRYHLTKPWRVAPTIIGELRGLIWACRLARTGPKYVHGSTEIDGTMGAPPRDRGMAASSEKVKLA